MKNLIFITLLTILVACKKAEVKPTTDINSSTVTVNGNSVTTSATPTDSGQYVTIYYDTKSKLMTLNIKNAKTNDNINLLIYTDKSLNNYTTSLNSKDYQANYYPGNVQNLMNKKVTGTLTINNLNLDNGKVLNFSAKFSFVQTATDVYGNSYEHKIENVSINNLKQTE